jgi:hypothetical protein
MGRRLTRLHAISGLKRPISQSGAGGIQVALYKAVTAAGVHGWTSSERESLGRLGKDFKEEGDY